jgi:hypothetical protein
MADRSRNLMSRAKKAPECTGAQVEGYSGFMPELSFISQTICGMISSFAREKFRRPRDQPTSQFLAAAAKSPAVAGRGRCRGSRARSDFRPTPRGLWGEAFPDS